MARTDLDWYDSNASNLCPCWPTVEHCLVLMTNSVLNDPIQPGTSVMFEGVATAFRPEPLMVTLVEAEIRLAP
jgi:hypothetical protein